ncbi:MAG: hypothetical protein ACRDD7_13395 [Peptostreptococcaceae bacterium]
MKLKQVIIKLKNKQLIEEFNSLTVSDKALNDYKKRVRNNQSEDEVTLTNKLKRNFLCGKFVRCSREGTETRRYGNLYIHCKDNIIISIFNEKGDWIANDVLEINEEIKNTIDKYIGRR